MIERREAGLGKMKDVCQRDGEAEEWSEIRLTG